MPLRQFNGLGRTKQIYLCRDLLVEFEHVLGILEIGLHPLLVLLVRDAEAVGHLNALLVNGT